jgi:hypothetical protein
MSKNPFDYVNSITTTKQHMLEGDADAEKRYNAYLVNRSLSYFVDTIFLANSMNTNAHVDNRMQYDYLFYAVNKKRRFSKWHKPESNNQSEIEAIKTVFGYNENRARQVFNILKPQDIKKILKECQHMNGK